MFPCEMIHALLALNCLAILSIIATCQCLDLRRCNGMTIRCRKALKSYTEYLLPPCVFILYPNLLLFVTLSNICPFTKIQSHCSAIHSNILVMQTVPFISLALLLLMPSVSTKFSKTYSSLCVQQISTVAFCF